MAQQHVVVAVAVQVAEAGELPIRVSGQIGRAALADRDGAVRNRIVVPASVAGIAQQDVVGGVAVEIADADEGPVVVDGHRQSDAFVRSVAAIHHVVVPAAVFVAQQHVAVTVTVEIADALEPPGPLGRQVGRAALADDALLAVHGVVQPAPVGVAQQEVVFAVAVEIANAVRGNGLRDRQRRNDCAGEGKKPLGSE